MRSSRKVASYAFFFLAALQMVLFLAVRALARSWSPAS